MNRTIKFRGKSLNTNMWVYGDLLHKGKKTFIEYEVIPETVGQFTELTDKNGREIYEGDIMQIGTEKAVVIYSANGFYQKIINDGPTYCNFNMYEVIGNIHDNPELITNNKVL